MGGVLEIGGIAGFWRGFAGFAPSCGGLLGTFAGRGGHRCCTVVATCLMVCCHAGRPVRWVAVPGVARVRQVCHGWFEATRLGCHQEQEGQGRRELLRVVPGSGGWVGACHGPACVLVARGRGGVARRRAAAGGVRNTHPSIYRAPVAVDDHPDGGAPSGRERPEEQVEDLLPVPVVHPDDAPRSRSMTTVIYV